LSLLSGDERPASIRFSATGRGCYYRHARLTGCSQVLRTGRSLRRAGRARAPLLRHGVGVGGDELAALHLEERREREGIPASFKHVRLEPLANRREWDARGLDVVVFGLSGRVARLEMSGCMACKIGVWDTDVRVGVAKAAKGHGLTVAKEALRLGWPRIRIRQASCKK
jgi:hypothetical protein